ncbi:hypothetical protein F5141DRAFT_1202466, partial [Pisolithus sp. B1]
MVLDACSSLSIATFYCKMTNLLQSKMSSHLLSRNTKVSMLQLQFTRLLRQLFNSMIIMLMNCARLFCKWFFRIVCPIDFLL